MLTYLILTTKALIMAAVTSGTIVGSAKIESEKRNRLTVWFAALAGLVFSFVTATLRNTTSLIDSAILNGWIYAVSLVTFLLYLIFISVKPLRCAKNRLLKEIPYLLLSVLIFTVIAYAAPDVWAFPYQVLLSEKTVISTDFLVAMIGVILGVILAVLIFLSVEKSICRLSRRASVFFLIAELTLNAALRLAGLLSVFFQKKVIKSNHTLFTYTVFVKNHTNWFIFISLAVAVLAAVMLWILSFKQKEAYRNPAEHRKIRAKWRNIRRWAASVAVSAVAGVLVLTVVEKINSTDVTLSPIEEVSGQDDENVYVGFDLVSDGHLHRFAYETEKGIKIRFIVIKKPNSSSYGIGLDACDVCGETGYYEKDGQVVCNLCDVVMNISTIGFKGGCNPIVIPYEIDNGQIVVPISGLMEYESEFK